MPYLLIILFILFLFCVCNDITKKKENPSEPLRVRRFSDAIEIVTADGDNDFSLIIYNHDSANIKQLEWALTKAFDVKKFEKDKVYILNLATSQIYRWYMNNEYVKVTDFTMMKGHPSTNSTSYMVVIKDKGRNLLFNTIIKTV